MTWLEQLRTVLRTPALGVWCLFLLTSPIYVFESGLPQPGDMFVFLLLPFTLFSWNGRLDRDGSQSVRQLLWFTAWATVVNLGWAAVLSQWDLLEFVIFPFFYVFNASVFICALIIGRRDPARFLRTTLTVASITIAYQVIGSLFVSGSSRGQVFFNSPNQLGFYAVLVACLIAMAQRPLNLGRVMPAIGLTGCAYLATLSASRSAVAGILVLLFFMVFTNPRTILLASLAAAGFTMVGGPVSDAIESSKHRAFEDRNPNKSFIQERGIDRIIEHPEYLALGAGEGDVDRFRKHAGEAGELHNSFGSLLFSYGIVGFVLFAVFVLRVVRNAPKRMTLLFLPVAVYMFAHNGLRATTLWVLFACFVLLKKLDNRSDAQSRR